MGKTSIIIFLFIFTYKANAGEASMVRVSINKIESLYESRGYEVAAQEILEVQKSLDLDEEIDILGLVTRWAKQSESHKERLWVTRYLLSRAQNGSEKIKELSIMLLLNFYSFDFLEDDKNILLKLYRDTPTPDLIRLIGILNVDSLYDSLLKHSIVDNVAHIKANNLKYNQSWAAMLALARMGDGEFIRKVLERVEEEKDLIFQSTILFRDLEYVAQPEVLEWLKIRLSSTERLPPIKKDKGSLVSWSAARSIVSMTKGSPDILMLSEEDTVDVVSNWLKSTVPELKR